MCKKSRFLTIPQLADELCVSERTIWRRVDEGKIVVHVLNGATRISREDADDYVRRCRRDPTSLGGSEDDFDPT